MADTPVVRLLKELMGIPSTSEEEHAIGVFLAQYLEKLGYSVELVPIAPGSDRCNVYAYLGNNRQARTLLTSHMDTVPPHIPLQIRGDIIYGRGACDDKGPMAAQIVALEELRAEGLLKNGDASLLFVVGEEKGGPGMLAANDMDLSWEAVMFGEPTEGKLATGHKGHYVFELLATGVACHSGYPERGKSATTTLFSLLEELRRLELPVSELLGPTTFHCGKVQGGVAYNVLAADAYALCGVRVAADLPGIERMVAETVSKYPEVTLKKSFAYSETLLDHEVEGRFSAHNSPSMSELNNKCLLTWRQGWRPWLCRLAPTFHACVAITRSIFTGQGQFYMRMVRTNRSRFPISLSVWQCIRDWWWKRSTSSSEPSREQFQLQERATRHEKQIKPKVFGLWSKHHVRCIAHRRLSR